MVDEPHYHQERRDAAYSKIKDDFFEGNALLLALLLGQYRVLEKASFSELFKLFNSVSGNRPKHASGLIYYLLPKISSEEDCAAVYKLCDSSAEAGTLVIEKLATYLKGRQATFSEYENIFMSLLKAYKKEDICRNFPLLAEGWFSAVSCDEDLKGALRYCSSEAQEALVLRAWYESKFVRPYVDLDRAEAEKRRQAEIANEKEKLLKEIGGQASYTQLLKYLTLIDEIRQFNCLLSSDPNAVVRQSCGTEPFWDYRIGEPRND